MEVVVASVIAVVALDAVGVDRGGPDAVVEVVPASGLAAVSAHADAITSAAATHAARRRRDA
jgi:hypothetical protein